MMRRLIRVLKILGKGVLVLALLSALALGVLRVVWGCQLAAEIASIKAKGEPISVADIPQPQVPDSQNAAFIYEEAFRETQGDEFGDTIREVMKAFEQDDPSSLVRAAELLKPYRHTIGLIEQAATMPQCLFPPSNPRDIHAKRPESELRRLSQLLGYSARIKAGQGDADGAVRSIETQLRAGSCPRRDAFTMPWIHRLSSIGGASSTLRKCAAQVTINEAQARELYEAFGKVDMKSAFVYAYRGERAHMNEMLTLERTDRKRLYEKLGVKNYNPPPYYKHPIWLIQAKIVMIGDQAACLHLMGELIGSANITYKEFVAKRVGEGIPFYARLTRSGAPMWEGSFKGHTRARAEIAGSQIFLALLAYHDRYGSYPHSLDELRAKLGWTLEKDPFTGKDFVYRRDGRGFILYSLDNGLQDNGGITRTKGSESGAPRDIVWQLSR